MEVSLERECSALGGLFHQIIMDMKVRRAPFWAEAGRGARVARPRTAPRRCRPFIDSSKASKAKHRARSGPRTAGHLDRALAHSAASGALPLEPMPQCRGSLRASLDCWTAVRSEVLGRCDSSAARKSCHFDPSNTTILSVYSYWNAQCVYVHQYNCRNYVLNQIFWCTLYN